MSFNTEWSKVENWFSFSEIKVSYFQRNNLSLWIVAVRKLVAGHKESKSQVQAESPQEFKESL